MTTDVAPRSVFVYGTLKPKRSRWPLLQPYADPAAPPWPDTIAGQLWDTPYGWPAVTLTPTHVVHGLVVTLAAGTAAHALTVLDEVEGVAHDLFQRVTVTTGLGHRCAVYVWPHDSAGFTPHPGPW